MRALIGQMIYSVRHKRGFLPLKEGVAKGCERPEFATRSGGVQRSTLSTGVAKSGRAVLLRHPLKGRETSFHILDRRTIFFAMLVNRAVGGGFSTRHNVRCGAAVSRAKAPSHSPAQKTSLRYDRLLALLSLACLSFLPPAKAEDFLEDKQEIVIPATFKSTFGETAPKLFAWLYKPAGNGPFPLIVINHGSPRSADHRKEYSARYPAQSEAFVKLGFVVVNPLRRGYGKSEGNWSEGYYDCVNPTYFDAGLESARDIAQTIAYMKTQPFVDPKRIVVVGQSAGGFGALALASTGPEGLLGVINFAGGRGSIAPEEVCAPDKLVEAFGRYARSTTVPSLWFYAENDRFFSPALAHRFLEAYRHFGRTVDFEVMPSFGSDGHALFSTDAAVPLWLPKVNQFLLQVGAIQEGQGK